MTWLHRWRQLMSLPAAHRWLLLKSPYMLAWVRIGLRWRGYAAMRAWADQAVCCDEATLTLEEIQALGRVVNLAARHCPFEVTCLPRSLWLQRILRSLGVDSELCIGVRLDEAGFAAHAWVEWAGAVVNDTPEFVSLYSRMPHGYDVPQG